MKKLISLGLTVCMMFSMTAASFAETGNEGKSNVVISTTVNGQNVTTQLVDGELVTQTQSLTETEVKDQINRQDIAEVKDYVKPEQGVAENKKCDSFTQVKVDEEMYEFYNSFLGNWMKRLIEESIEEYIKTHKAEVKAILDSVEEPSEAK